LLFALRCCRLPFDRRGAAREEAFFTGADSFSSPPDGRFDAAVFAGVFLVSTSFFFFFFFFSVQLSIVSSSSGCSSIGHCRHAFAAEWDTLSSAATAAFKITFSRF